MPKLVLVSPSGVWNKEAAEFYPDVIEALRKVKEAGEAVFVISNLPQPEWFPRVKDFAVFQPCSFSAPRQSGKIVKELIKKNEKIIDSSDVIVLGSNDEDLIMAANSQSLLIRCDWVKDLGGKIRKYGVPLKFPKSIPQAIKYLADSAPWHFRKDSNFLVSCPGSFDTVRVKI